VVNLAENGFTYSCLIHSALNMTSNKMELLIFVTMVLLIL
jgi:hypothetical protein